MNNKVLTVITCVFLILAAVNARAIELSSLLTQKSIIKFNADKVLYNNKTGIYNAEGNVRISKGNAVVSARHVVFNSKTYNILAEGHVHWSIAKEVINADKLKINLFSETGTIYNGYISIDNGAYTIKGRIIKKVSAIHFIIEDGSLTTCKCNAAKPAWSISAKYINATFGKYATIKDAVFRVKGLPIAYVPWATIPIKTKRESGFLIPNYTYSALNGFTLTLPYFWAISQDKDATFYFDAMTKRGLGVGAQFRYAETTKVRGQLDARYFKEFFLPYKRDRFYIGANYYQDLAEGFFSKGLLNYYSDRQYLSDFYTLLQKSSVEYVESKFTLQKNFNDADVLGSLIYLEDMRAPDNNATLQQLPLISFSYFPVHITSLLPLYVEFNTNFEDFMRSEPALPKGQRYGIIPGIYFPFTLGHFFYFNSEARYSVYFYNTGTYGIYKPGSMMSTHLSTEVSTKLSRVFHIKLGTLKAVKHIVTPFVSIAATHTIMNNEPYTFDKVENNARDSQYIYFGIHNSFIGKTKPYANMVSYPIIGRFDVDSGYDLMEAGRKLTVASDKREPFLPINLALVLQPTNLLSTNINMSVNPATLSLTRTTIMESVGDQRGNRISLGYSYLRTMISSLNTYINFVATPHLSFYGNVNYSFYDRSLIQGVYGIRFSTKSNCWSINASFIQRPLTPSRNTISVYLTLKGLGTIGR